MRALVVVLLAASVVLAADAPAPSTRTHLDVVVPVDPREHERLHFFGRPEHHVVPGTVTINGAAYACDPHGLRFSDREVFVAHLRSVHHKALEDIPDALVVIDGRVHFVGE
jgi:hypothetical protein